MRKILLDNAYESWSSAIEYHDYIKQGYATIKYKKQFVSSLHNAVELFLKQILLDKNDHDVAEIKKVKNADMANLRAEYYASHNLNQFFEDLEPIRKLFLMNGDDFSPNNNRTSKMNKSQIIFFFLFVTNK